MAAQNQGGPGIDQFDLYFRRADLDNDGRISGAEAVSFFQGSGLPKQVLAQIWMHADHNRAGFLNRQEFYNALKLVTVAQSKRDLTPEIVKAALYGPAASKIPAPQINIPPPLAGQLAPLSVLATPQMAPAGSSGLLNSGIRGPVTPNMTMNQQMAPAGSVGLLNPGIRGPVSPNMTLNQQMTPAGSTGLNPGVRGPVPPNMAMNHQMTPSGSTGLLNPGVRGPVTPNVTMNQQYFPSQGNQMIRPSNVVPAGSASQPLQSGTALPNTAMPTDWLGVRANTMTSGPTSQAPTRGFSPTVSSPLPKAQDLQLTPSQAVAKDSISYVSGNGPTSSSSGGDLFSAIVPLPKKDSSSSANSASSTPTSSALVPVTSVLQSSSTRSPLDSLQSSFPQQGLGGQLPQPQPGGGVAQMPQTNTFSQSQPASQAVSSPVVPGISQGLGNSTPSESHPPWPKMTPAGIQKYSKVFMEVDSDRDGKITGDQARNLFLSWRLPREVLKQVWDLADQDNDSMLSLREFCIALYMMERYREGRSLPASLPQNVMFDEALMRLAGMPNSSYGNAAWGAAAGFRQMPEAPGSQQMPPGGGLRPPMLVPGPQVDAPRTFNQGKSPTSQLDGSQPNQLRSEEHNAQDLSPSVATDTEKKVEKVILDSKEKLEYYRAKMQDLVLYKSRCDSRLNEIIERASADKREAEMAGKKYEEKYKQVAEIASKLTVEEATFRENEGRKMELRQAIINIEQGGSADGILQVRADRIQSDLEELMKALSDRCKKRGLEIKSATVIELPTGWQPGIQEGAAIWDEDWDKFDDEGLVFDKDLSVDIHIGTTDSKPKSTSFVDDMYPQDGGYSPDSSTYADGKSEKQSSRGERVPDSESGYAHSEDDSVRSPTGSPAHPAADFVDVFTKSEADNESHRFDDQGWGTFDGNDDVDSVWGFNTNSKDQRDDRLFDSGSFGLSPVKTTDSPRAEGNFRSKPSPFFADSVPGTPFSKAANSPRYSEAGDNYFDTISRFDSFSMSDSRFSPPRETFSRFDSINSGRGETFARFDSVNSSKGEAVFGRFDGSRGFNSFDDADPFGSSGPFKAASESRTPKKSSDGWSSF